MKIFLATDSACDKTYEQIQQEKMFCIVIPHFHVYPNKVGMDNCFHNTKEWREKTYSELNSGSKIKTHSVSPEKYDFLIQELPIGQPVLYISLSGQMSGTSSNAQVFFAKANELNKSNNLVCFDSRTCSGGMDILIDKALSIIDNQSIDIIVKELNKLRDKIKTYFFTTDFSQFNFTGRLKHEVKKSNFFELCYLGDVTIDGKLEYIKTCRSKKTVIKQIVQDLNMQIEKSNEHAIQISYADDFQSAQTIAIMIQKRFPEKRIVLSQVSPIVAATAGTKIVGVTFVKD